MPKEDLVELCDMKSYGLFQEDACLLASYGELVGYSIFRP